MKKKKGKPVTKNLAKVDVKVDEDEKLTLSTNHPQKSHELLSLFLASRELLPKVSNPKIRVRTEWVQDKFEGSPPNQIQISKGNEWKIAS